MTQPASDRNPFMLMIAPEVILAAIEKSERLGQLNRHLCRPLDRPTTTPDSPADTTLAGDDDEDSNGDGLAGGSLGD